MKYHFLTATYNRHEQTFNSVNDIVEQMQLLQKDYRVVIIEAGDADLLRKKFGNEKYKKVEIISVTDQTFWTTAMSIGVLNLLNNSKSNDVFALFNNDIRVPSNTLSELIKYNYDSPIAVSPISISSNDNKSVSTGVKVLFWPLCIHKTEYINLTVDEANNLKNVEVEFMTQRFLWCGRHVIESAGNYRADIFRHYAGDYELTARMAKKGFKVILDPSIHIYIDESDTGLNSRYRSLNFFQRVQSLFSIKSSSNLWIAIKFSFIVAPWWSQPFNMVIMTLKAFVRAMILKPRK
jgi:GT2 family glycosyltransferase